MYNNGLENIKCQGQAMEPCIPVSESMQALTAEILEMTKISRGITYSIENGLFGARVDKGERCEPNINCEIDALKEIRINLSRLLETLESISSRM